MEITLALGGGGAKGNAHIGVLRRLETEGFKIKSIAGTSIGGLIGILYAYGYTPTEIQKIFENIDQNRLYERDAQDGPALLGLKGTRQLLDQTVGEKTFADLRIPCAVTSVNLKNGSEVILAEGKLKEAVLATIAMPGIFPTQHINNWELVDGGVLNPVPVSVARMLSPNLPIVAVPLTEPLDAPIRGYSIPIPSMLPRAITERIARISLAQSLNVFLRSVDAGSRTVAYLRLQIDKPDVIIHPDVHHIDLLDEVIVADVAKLGEQAVEFALLELKQAVSWISQLKRKFSVNNAS
jgi:NTE family protein